MPLPLSCLDYVWDTYPGTSGRRRTLAGSSSAAATDNIGKIVTNAMPMKKGSQGEIEKLGVMTEDQHRSLIPGRPNAYQCWYYW